MRVYGKTTLANALCRDEDVRFDFDDGILRVEVGKERDDVTSLVIDLIEQQTGKRHSFQNVQAASEHLAEVIMDAAVTGLGVYGSAIALGEALGRIHVFDGLEFLTPKG